MVQILHINVWHESICTLITKGCALSRVPIWTLLTGNLVQCATCIFVKSPDNLRMLCMAVLCTSKFDTDKFSIDEDTVLNAASSIFNVKESCLQCVSVVRS